MSFVASRIPATVDRSHRRVVRRTCRGLAVLMSMAVLALAAVSGAGAAKAQTGATVITIEGMDFGADRFIGLMGRQLQSLARTDGNVQKRLDYPANQWFGVNSAAADKLETMIESTPGPIVVLGHSEGAQVASIWLDRHGDDPAQKNRLVFVLIGNPQRAGASLGKDISGKQLHNTRTDSQYQVIDIARRGDRWARASGWDRGSSHTDYTKVSVDPKAPGNAIEGRVGNTVYLAAN